MTNKRPLFGLRFDSDVELNPTPAELRTFLATAVKPGTLTPQGSDLARYRQLLEELLAYEGDPDTASQGVREKMFYAVIRRSQFANPGLELAVGQYKYHLHALQAIDLRKPAAFIRTAEAELAKLNPKKKDDAEKRARLLPMLMERKRELELLIGRPRALADELGRIARYVRDNLVGIENLCKASIAIFADPGVLQQEEKQMIDGLKDRFKERLKDALHRGEISRTDLEIARKDVEVLEKETSSLVQEDLAAVSGLLMDVYDHAKEHAQEIDRLLTELSGAEDAGALDSGGPLVSLEGVLVSLLSGYRFELRASALHSRTAYTQLLKEIRKDLFSHIVDLLKQDRRARYDRRTKEDRRRRREPHVEFTERRSARDRRSGKSRRS
jgi:hypothetical protein